MSEKTDALRKQDSVDLPPDISRSEFDGMLTIMRGMGSTMTARGDSLPSELAYAVSIVALRLGLEPTLGHVLILGSKPYITVGGLLYNANQRDEFDGLEARPATPEERVSFYSPGEPPPDEHLWRCEVRIKDRSLPAVAWGRAMVATHRIGERASRDNRFSPSQAWSIEMAAARSIGRALRRAFCISSPTYEEMVTSPEEQQTGVIEVNADPVDEPKSVRPKAAAVRPEAPEPEVAVVVEEPPVVEPEPEPKPAKRRPRRSKAEIEADKAYAESMNVSEEEARTAREEAYERRDAVEADMKKEPKAVEPVQDEPVQDDIDWDAFS